MAETGRSGATRKPQTASRRVQTPSPEGPRRTAFRRFTGGITEQEDALLSRPPASGPSTVPLRSDDAPDAEQLDELRRELRDEAMAKLHGTAAGAFRAECQADEARRIDWRALLRAWLHERVKGDWQSYPFSKRHVHRGLFMPSPGLAVPGHVVFAIDTSGSMSDDTLAQLMGEVRAFRETFASRLTVIQADAAVQSVHSYEAMDGAEVPKRLTVAGRGGTDFRPVFDWVANQGEGAIVLYATDGLGTYPAHPPHTPVIWLLTPPHVLKEKVPFGAVVPLPAP